MHTSLPSRIHLWEYWKQQQEQKSPHKTRVSELLVNAPNPSSAIPPPAEHPPTHSHPPLPSRFSRCEATWKREIKSTCVGRWLFVGRRPVPDWLWSTSAGPPSSSLRPIIISSSTGSTFELTVNSLYCYIFSYI